jgi:hypothetical protein
MRIISQDRSQPLTTCDYASLADRSVIGDDAELTLAVVQIKSYCIHGWPPGLFCASLRDDEHVIPVGRTCHHVTVEVQPLHTN